MFLQIRYTKKFYTRPWYTRTFKRSLFHLKSRLMIYQDFRGLAKNIKRRSKKKTKKLMQGLCAYYMLNHIKHDTFSFNKLIPLTYNLCLRFELFKKQVFKLIEVNLMLTFQTVICTFICWTFIWTFTNKNLQLGQPNKYFLAGLSARNYTLPQNHLSNRKLFLINEC